MHHEPLQLPIRSIKAALLERGISMPDGTSKGALWATVRVRTCLLRTMATVTMMSHMVMSIHSHALLSCRCSYRLRPLCPSPPPSPKAFACATSGTSPSTSTPPASAAPSPYSTTIKSLNSWTTTSCLSSCLTCASFGEAARLPPPAATITLLQIPERQGALGQGPAAALHVRSQSCARFLPHPQLDWCTPPLPLLLREQPFNPPPSLPQTSASMLHLTISLMP